MIPVIRIMLSVAAIAAAVSTAATAQELDPEATMRLIGSEALELPVPVSELLALPDTASSIAAERNRPGLGQANERRTTRVRLAPLQAAASQDRLAIAADARSRGAELGAEMAEAVRALRESVVRGEGPIALPMPTGLPKLPEHAPSQSVLPGLPADRPMLR